MRSANRLDLEKTIWGSPAGKKRIAGRLVGMLPAHKTYVEPFAGSAAVLFEKEPAEVEVINDADLEIAKAYRIIKRLGKNELAGLRKRAWVGDEATFKGLFDTNPKSDVDWLYKFLYVTHFSYGKMRGKSFSPASKGVEAKTIDRIEKFGPRLKKVRVFGGDYRPVVKKFDGKDTAMFLDPPYPGYNVDVGESEFNEREFVDVLTALKGKFLITYGVRGEFPRLIKETGFDVRRIRTRRSIASMRGVGGPTLLTQLLVSNYGLTAKSLDGLRHDGWDVDDAARVSVVVPADLKHTPDAPAPPATPTGESFAKTSNILKSDDTGDERFVLGVVLEPEVIDAQGDIYSADEIRQAAHRFMEEFGGLGLMHRLRVNDDVKVVENYLAPVDFQIGDAKVRKGTWLLGVHVLSDALWAQVKEQKLTGFSIGGSARRVPEVPETTPTPETQGDAS